MAQKFHPDPILFLQINQQIFLDGILPVGAAEGIHSVQAIKKTVSREDEYPEGY